MLSRFQGFDGVSATGRAAGSFFVPPVQSCRLSNCAGSAPFSLYQLLVRVLAGLLSLLFVQQEVKVFVL